MEAEEGEEGRLHGSDSDSDSDCCVCLFCLLVKDEGKCIAMTGPVVVCNV